jgi:endogenous inhibitor of DNA gyrase (YacG/DUF329 family)
MSDVEIEINEDYSVNITGRCPYCSEVVNYDRFSSFFMLTRTPCPICNKGIAINPIEHFETEELKQKAEILAKNNNIAIWPITLFNFFWLYRAMPALKADNIT